MNWLNKLSMRSKVLVSPVIAAALMIASSTAAYIGIRQQQVSLQSIRQERIPAMKTAERAYRGIAAVHANVYKLLAMMEGTFPAERVASESAEIKTELDRLSSQLKSASTQPGLQPNERASLDTAAKSIIEYQKVIAEVIDVASVQVSMGTAMMSKAQLKYDETTQELRKLTELEDQQTDGAYVGAEKTALRANIGVIVALILSVALSILAAVYVASSIAKSLASIRNATAKLSEGDIRQVASATTASFREAGRSFGAELDVERNDEIGELARSFSRTVSYLSEMAEISEAVARGDLSREVRPRSQRDVLGNAIARMSEGLRVLVGKVRDSASEVASASRQVAAGSEETSKVGERASTAIDDVTTTMHEMNTNVQSVVRNTNMQSSSVADTSSSIEQMVAAIQRVASMSKSLLEISDRSEHEVVAGISTMNKTTDGLNRINESIRSSAENIDQLGNRAESIGKIIEVIDDIAEQTNLLALNAAIEAARAGEHGLGFAVVADEVRKLAEKSALATKEIGDLIHTMQDEARNAVKKMEKNNSIVDEGLSLGQDLGTALKNISKVVAEVHRLAQEIGSATTEQSRGSEMIARAANKLKEITQEIHASIEEQASGTQAVVTAMDRMRDLVQQSTSSSTELTASAEQMSTMSRRLLEFIGHFKLEGAKEQKGQKVEKRESEKSFYAVVR